MPRRGWFRFGIVLIAVGVALPALAYFLQPSDRELTPFDVMADLSGAQTMVAFTSHRNDSYSAFVAMKTPPGTEALTSTLDCLLRNPDAVAENFCPVRGQLTVVAEIADSNGSKTSLNEADPPVGYWTVGGTAVTATRDLGFFNTIAGHHYVVTARFKSDDPTIRRLKPRLTAHINDPGINESLGLAYLAFLAAALIGAVLALTGIVIAVRTRSRTS